MNEHGLIGPHQTRATGEVAVPLIARASSRASAHGRHGVRGHGGLFTDRMVASDTVAPLRAPGPQPEWLPAAGRLTA
ncbi:MAG: hypothetical protein QOK21_4186 [Solirubrobacteraceae bacterium]|jgi:hypothetical protein|nr:hypothetical protein [Solirubrobacteraceae bacterium]